MLYKQNNPFYYSENIFAIYVTQRVCTIEETHLCTLGVLLVDYGDLADDMMDDRLQVRIMYCNHMNIALYDSEKKIIIMRKINSVTSWYNVDSFFEYKEL